MTDCLDNWSCECSLCIRLRDSRAVVLPNSWFEHFGNGAQLRLKAAGYVGNVHRSEQEARNKKGRFVKINGIPIVDPAKFVKLQNYMLRFFQKHGPESFKLCVATDLIAADCDGPFGGGSVGDMYCEFHHSEHAHAFRLDIHQKNADKSHRLRCEVFGGYEMGHEETSNYTLRPNYKIHVKVEKKKRFCLACGTKVATIGNRSWCFPCSKRNKQDPFAELPLEVVLDKIVPHLSVQDVVNTLSCSKSSKETFDVQDVWKTFFQSKAVDTFVKKSLKKFVKSKDRPLPSWTWTKDLLTNPENSTTLVIVNKSDVPYHIFFGTKATPLSFQRHMRDGWHSAHFWDDQKGRLRVQDFEHHGHVRPGSRFVTGKVRPNTKWVLIPTREWLMRNPVSNRCFSFQVDVTKVQEYTFGKTTKPCFVKEITKSFQKPMPIKGYKVDDFKKGFIKLATNQQVNQKRLEEGEREADIQSEEMVTLNARMRVLEKQMRTTTTKNDSLRMVKKIHKN